MVTEGVPAGEAAAAERPRPPAFERWAALVLLSVAMFGNYYVYDAVAPVADLLGSQLGFTDEQIGLLYSTYSWAAVIVLLAGGVVIDRFGTARSVLVFGAICTVAGIATAVSSDFRVMAAGRFLLGIGAEPLIVAVTTAIAKWFKGKELSFAFGLNLTIARLGSVAADNSPTWARAAYDGWQGPMRVAAVLGATCLVSGVLYWMLENRVSRRYALGSAGGTDKLVLRQLFDFGKSYWYVVALCITFYSAIFPFRSFAIKFFMDARGLSREAAGALNSVLPLAAMFATPLFGLLADRVGHRALLMAIGSATLIPVYLLMVYTQVPLWIVIAFMGIAFSLIPAVMWPSVAYLVPEGRLGTAYALMTLVQQVGLAGMNWLVGATNDAARASAQNPAGYRPGMWIFTVLGFLGLLFSWLLWRTERGPSGHGLEQVR
ncbi:MAG TPA: MFS transporter [Anaeromyxobacteraceae bacterium]|nr:MFS transporter [Anaeromyxobacteraceae bacterium]